MQAVCGVAFRLRDETTMRYSGMCWFLPPVDMCLHSKIIKAIGTHLGYAYNDNPYTQYLYDCPFNQTFAPMCCPTITEEMMGDAVLRLTFAIRDTRMADFATRASSALSARTNQVVSVINQTHQRLTVDCEAPDAQACATFGVSVFQVSNGMDLFESFRVLVKPPYESANGWPSLLKVEYAVGLAAATMLGMAVVYFLRKRSRKLMVQRAYSHIETAYAVEPL